MALNKLSIDAVDLKDKRVLIRYLLSKIYIYIITKIISRNKHILFSAGSTSTYQLKMELYPILRGNEIFSVTQVN